MRGIPTANKRTSAMYTIARRIEGAHRHVAKYEGDTATKCHKIRSIEDRLHRAGRYERGMTRLDVVAER